MWRKLLPIFIVTFLLYLAVIYISSSTVNFDTKSYTDIGSLTLSGKSIYPDPAISRHPYLPLFLYFEAFTQIASTLFHIPQINLIKVILSLFQLLSVYAVYVLSKRSVKTTLFYALNPLSLLIIAFHGQFDIIPVTCMLFSIIAIQKKEWAKTAFLLSCAVTIKTWPILFILPFFKRMPKKYVFYLLPLPIITLLIYSFLFHTSLFSIIRVLVVYQGVGSIWGLGKLLSLVSTSKLVSFCYKIIFVFGMLLYSLNQKKKLLHEELLGLLFFFFIFTPGFGIQWLLWLTPFLFLTKKPFAYVFMAALVICLAITYLSWIPSFTLSPLTIPLIYTCTWLLFLAYPVSWRIKNVSV